MKNKKTILSAMVVIAFIVGVALKIYYIRYTPVWIRQHDVIGFGAEEGHAAYIEYILNNRALPDFDPRTLWAFFQPPLHHIISAIFLGINYALSINAGKAQENLQILPFIYMVGVMIFTVLIYKQFEKEINDNRTTESVDLSKKSFFGKMDCFGDYGLFIVLCVVAVHPIYTIMSGSINNDALSLVLAVVSLYLSILWYRNGKITTIALMGFTIGLSMMAKLTGGLVAVPIGTLMIIRLLDAIKSQKKTTGSDLKKVNEAGNSKLSVLNIIIEYVVFAVIVAPIGLYWTIRNIILWNMPVNYIPGVGEQLSAGMSKWDRIFNITVNSPYPMVEGKNADYSEFNVIISLIKTSLFGEWDYSEYSSKITILAWGLFVIGIILIAVCLIATFYMTFSKNSGLCLEGRVVLFLTWITYLIAYLSFALSYNNFSAEDFRYGAVCIAIEGIFLGLFANKVNSKLFKSLIFICSSLFAMFAVLVYVAVGLKS